MITKENYSLVGSDGKPISIDITLNSAEPNAPLIIFIHGFKGFKDWGAHNLVACYFAENGFRYLKFNLSHSGVTAEKPADISDMEAFGANTVSKELFDIDVVINYAAQNLGAKNIFLIGHSRGGGLSILEATKNMHVKALITWSAISSFDSLWKKEQEADWKSNGKIYILNARTKETMPLNSTLLEDFEANKARFNILESAKRINIPWLIVHGAEDVNVPFEIAQKLAESNSTNSLVKIEDGNHVYGASHPYQIETLPSPLLQVCEESLAFLKNL